MFYFSDLPEELEEEVLTANLNRARADFQDEHIRSKAGFNSNPDPASRSYGGGSGISAEDLASLRKKFKFLEDFSDQFIRSTPYEALLKTETTALKLSEYERTKAASNRLSNNRDNLATTLYKVPGGSDNRWDQIHEARFLPGVGCSAARMWLRAREVMGSASQVPISTYDMGSVGLGGYVSKKGWVELHNVGSDSLSLRYFNINSCGNRVGGSEGGEGEFKEISELGEFKLALRVAREALSFVFPWNKSVAAIEGFMLQSDFCRADLTGVDKPATILTQFVDYCLGENADRWRAHEPFLNTGDLRGAWDSFFGAKPVSSMKRVKKEGGSEQKQKGAPPQKKGFMGLPPNFFDDICNNYNLGRCMKPPGTCATSKGIALRHVCNFRADLSIPTNVCGKDHPRIFNHK